MVSGFFIALEELDFVSKLLHFDNRAFFEHGLLRSIPLNLIDFLCLGAIDFVHELGGIILLRRRGSQLLVLVTQCLDDFIKIDALHELHLSSHALQMIQSLDFSRLELDQLVLLDLLELHLVPQPVEHLVLRSDLILDLHKLLLEYLLTLLSFGELLPQHGIGAELLLEVVDLIIVLLLLNSFFKLLQHS